MVHFCQAKNQYFSIFFWIWEMALGVGENRGTGSVKGM